MNTVVVFFLLIAGSGGGNSVGPSFATLAACEAAVVQVDTLSANKKNMAYLKGICVKAEVIKGVN